MPEDDRNTDERLASIEAKLDAIAARQPRSLAEARSIAKARLESGIGDREDAVRRWRERRHKTDKEGPKTDKEDPDAA